MEWYQYLAIFFSGAFLANSIPHFIHGISGDKFPTPFAKPPGKGLSPAYVNVLWAALNMIVGYVLWHFGKIKPGNHPAMAVFFVGAIVMALMLSSTFTKKYRDQ